MRGPHTLLTLAVFDSRRSLLSLIRAWSGILGRGILGILGYFANVRRLLLAQVLAIVY